MLSWLLALRVLSTQCRHNESVRSLRHLAVSLVFVRTEGVLQSRDLVQVVLASSPKTRAVSTANNGKKHLEKYSWNF